MCSVPMEELPIAIASRNDSGRGVTACAAPGTGLSGGLAFGLAAVSQRGPAFD